MDDRVLTHNVSLEITHDEFDDVFETLLQYSGVITSRNSFQSTEHIRKRCYNHIYNQASYLCQIFVHLSEI